MAYTAFERMRQINRERFGTDVGPMQPKLFQSGAGNDLKSAALRFLHERCEGLRFDAASEAAEADGPLLGAGLKAHQIPYNMQMDVERLCLEHELEKFFDSGVAEDAYTVYYCYLEMFVGQYGHSRRMVELLSEFESNASSLLMKHRDHYSHSVYVFALGLAIYETNAAYRETFRRFYCPDADEHAAAAFFLEYWGLTSLFHDIGYPFEIPFEQVLAYFEVDKKERGQGCLYLSYHDLGALNRIDEPTGAHLEALFGRTFGTVDELLAFGIFERLGDAYQISEEALLDAISRKPTHPESFGYYMDHAYFSATRLFSELIEERGPAFFNRTHLDVLTAIMLHNSLYKFSIAFYKSRTKCKPPLRAALHPLAYLLMLCDELQCWDRTAYGRNSRTELHPMDAAFDFSGSAIRATYCFDRDESPKILAYQMRCHEWENGGEGDPPRLKAYSDMAEPNQRFLRDIERIVDLGDLPLSVDTTLKTVDYRGKHTYLSASSFLHMYDFAVALNARYRYEGYEDTVSTEQLEREFDELSLEYRLLNINQAKSFSKYLNAIGCFYTDKPVDFEMLHAFSDGQTAVFAPMEHERWVREHIAMGWTHGTEYRTVPVDGDEAQARAALREQMRRHALCMDGQPTAEQIVAHYRSLSPADQGKDWKPFNSMLKLIKKYDGLRIYRLS